MILPGWKYFRTYASNFAGVSWGSNGILVSTGHGWYVSRSGCCEWSSKGSSKKEHSC